MDKVLVNAKNLYMSELAKLVDKKDISSQNLDIHFKLIDMIKDICKIECYENDDDGDSYEGKYSVEGTFGRNNQKSSSMHNKLQKLMDEAENDHERNMIRSWMNQLNG